MKRTYILLFMMGLLWQSAWSQNVKLERVDPPFWWANMAETQLQLLVYGENISSTRVQLKADGVKLISAEMLENPNYLVLNLDLAEAEAGKFELGFMKGDEQLVSYTYELKGRTKGALWHQGLDAGDVMYLIMPDRFANGDASNDNIEGMMEAYNREFPGGKHGGDIQGIINHLDYLENLGVTTLWLNPVQENNMKEYSYHGYSITDHYQIDPRYGTNQLYKNFVSECHKREMKVVMDLIFNHCGLYHWWMDDLPSQDWLNQWPSFTQTNYHNATATDPYASDHDLKLLTDGWFVKTMPDLNQRNPYLANYLIQSSIWWIEYAGINGIRMDTYPYPDRYMMQDWVQRLRKEYPDFYIVGETWLHGVAYESYWQSNPHNRDGYDSKLPSISDFPLHYAMMKAFGSDNDIYKVFETLNKDFLYTDPFQLKIFADNHDLDRIFASLGEDMPRYKQTMGFLLTTRGIPQLLYGTEIAMKGKGDHGVIREDFPGGWEGDSIDVFEQKNMTATQQEAHAYLQKLLNWRKSSEAIARGKLKHFIPENDTYVYMRYTDSERVIVILHNGVEEIGVNLTGRYAELVEGYERAKDVISGEEVTDLGDVRVGAKGVVVLEL